MTMLLTSHFSPLTPLLAEADIGQVIFIIVFLVVGFIQWLIKTMKEKAEAAERARRVPTQQEAEARRHAWEQQTEPVTPPAPSPTSTQPIGGAVGDLLGEFRKAMQEAQRPPVPQHAPPPLPQAPPRAVRAPVPVEPRRERAESAVVMAEAQAASSVPVVVRHVPVNSHRRPHPFTALLHTQEGYRQAFVLREVIGPPRALHDFGGPED